MCVSWCSNAGGTPPISARRLNKYLNITLSLMFEGPKGGVKFLGMKHSITQKGKRRQHHLSKSSVANNYLLLGASLAASKYQPIIKVTRNLGHNGLTSVWIEVCTKLETNRMVFLCNKFLMIKIPTMNCRDCFTPHRKDSFLFGTVSSPKAFVVAVPRCHPQL